MTFAAPLFLLGLLGLFFPWLLHRLNDQNAPVQDFPSDRFLEATRSVSARQKRLRYLKLLAVRILMLMVLCLLFADPLIKKLQQVLGDPEQLHVLVIDQSFSMRFGSRWDDALEKITEVAEQVPAQMSVQLLTSSPALSSVTTPTTDRSVIKTAAASLKPGYDRVEFGPLMRMLGSFAEKSDLPVVVHLITDGQSSAMPTRMSDLMSPQLADLQLHNVADENSTNVAVTATLKPVDDKHFSIVAQVKGYGSGSGKADRTLSLSRDGNAVTQRVVALSEGDSAIEVFRDLEYPPEGRLVDYKITLTPEDDLAEDNSVTIPVRSEPPAIIHVVTDPRQIVIPSFVRGTNEVLYTRTALELDRRNQTEFEPLDSSGIGADVDVVIFLDNDTSRTATGDKVSLPDPPAALSDYLNGGGRVLHVINSSASAAEPIATPIAAVASVDSVHPLNLDLDEWSFVSFYAHQPLSVPSGASVLVTATDGYPVLVETDRTTGKLLYLNASVNGTDNDLPISAVFVPFLHSVINYFLRFDSYPSRLAVGDSVKLPQSVQILDPAGKPMLELAETTDGNAHVMSTPGVYTILDKRGEHSVVVETDAAESDMTIAGGELIDSWQAQYSDSTDESAGDSDTTAADTLADAGSLAMSLSKWLLPLCVLLVFVETLFANWYLKVRRTA